MEFSKALGKGDLVRAKFGHSYYPAVVEKIGDGGRSGVKTGYVRVGWTEEDGGFSDVLLEHIKLSKPLPLSVSSAPTTKKRSAAELVTVKTPAEAELSPQPVKKQRTQSTAAASVKTPIATAAEAPAAVVETQPARPVAPPVAAPARPTRTTARVDPSAPPMPAAIRFSTGLAPARVPASWSTKAGGTIAATFKAEGDVFRLAGSAVLRFTIPSSTSPGALLRRLNARVIAPRNEAASTRGLTLRCWNTRGEPASHGNDVPMQRLLSEVNAGKINPLDGHHTYDWLIAAVDLTVPNGPYKCPLIRTVCRATAASVLSPRSYGEEKELEIVVSVYLSRLYFYLIAYDGTRTLFNALRPATPIAAPLWSPPSHPRLFTSTHSSKAEQDAQYAFTIAGLLKAQEHPGYREAAQPGGIRLTMKSYQRQAVAWMEDMEQCSGAAFGINSLFWEAWKWPDGSGEEFYLFRAAGELRLETPPTTRGGVLAEEMGMGKTVEVVSLILNDITRARCGVQHDAHLKDLHTNATHEVASCEATAVVIPEDTVWEKCMTSNRRVEAGVEVVDCEIVGHSTEGVVVYTAIPTRFVRALEGASASAAAAAKAALAASAAVLSEVPPLPQNMIESASTLIIVPNALLDQWLDEIKKSCGDALVAKQYPTTAADLRRGVDDGCAQVSKQGAHKFRELQRLASCADIIVTSYAVMRKEAGKSGGVSKVLSRIRWRRVVLDEMQEVRSSTTDVARNCRSLEVSRARWMVSGTPLYEGIDDLNGELGFLRVLPFDQKDSTDGFWGRRIGRPWYGDSSDGFTQPDSRDLLDLLLRGVMMRHSKSQRTMEGDSILALPRASHSIVPVPVDPLSHRDASHAYLIGWSNMMAVEAIKGLLAQRHHAGVGNSVTEAIGVLGEQVINVMRRACISPLLITGGAGASSTIDALHGIIRRTTQQQRPRAGGNARQQHVVDIDAQGDEADFFRAMTVTEALTHFATTERNRRQTNRGQGAQKPVLEQIGDLQEKVQLSESQTTIAHERSWAKVKIVGIHVAAASPALASGVSSSSSSSSANASASEAKRYTFDVVSIDDGASWTVSPPLSASSHVLPSANKAFLHHGKRALGVKHELLSVYRADRELLSDITTRPIRQILRFGKERAIELDEEFWKAMVRIASSGRAMSGATRQARDVAYRSWREQIDAYRSKFGLDARGQYLDAEKRAREASKAASKKAKEAVKKLAKKGGKTDVVGSENRLAYDAASNHLKELQKASKQQRETQSAMNREGVRLQEEWKALCIKLTEEIRTELEEEQTMQHVHLIMRVPRKTKVTLPRLRWDAAIERVTSGSVFPMFRSNSEDSASPSIRESFRRINVVALRKLAKRMALRRAVDKETNCTVSVTTAMKAKYDYAKVEGTKEEKIGVLIALEQLALNSRMRNMRFDIRTRIPAELAKKERQLAATEAKVCHMRESRLPQLMKSLATARVKSSALSSHDTGERAACTKKIAELESKVKNLESSLRTTEKRAAALMTLRKEKKSGSVGGSMKYDASTGSLQEPYVRNVIALRRERAQKAVFLALRRNWCVAKAAELSAVMANFGTVQAAFEAMNKDGDDNFGTVRAALEAMNEDGDDNVEREEINAMLDGLDLPASFRKEADALLAACDTNMDGQISFQEFSEALYPKVEREEINAMLDGLDLPESFREEVNALVAACDTSMDGQISFQEFGEALYPKARAAKAASRTAEFSLRAEVVEVGEASSTAYIRYESGRAGRFAAELAALRSGIDGGVVVAVEGGAGGEEEDGGENEKEEEEDDEEYIASDGDSDDDDDDADDEEEEEEEYHPGSSSASASGSRSQSAGSRSRSQSGPAFASAAPAAANGRVSGSGGGGRTLFTKDERKDMNVRRDIALKTVLYIRNRTKAMAKVDLTDGEPRGWRPRTENMDEFTLPPAQTSTAVQLSKEVRRMSTEAALGERMLIALRPKHDILIRTHAMLVKAYPDEDDRKMHETQMRAFASTGFQAIGALEDDVGVAASDKAAFAMCPVCMEKIDLSRRPTVTPCMHLLCGTCAVASYHADIALKRNWNVANRNQAARCPACREDFTLDSLVRIRRSEAPPSASAALGASSSSSSSSSSSLGAAETSEQRAAALRAAANHPPRFSAACTTEDLSAMLQPPRELVKRSEHYPLLTARTVGHFAKATGGLRLRNQRAACPPVDAERDSQWLAPKLRLLIDRVQNLIDNDYANAKVVVFSQHADVIKHCDVVLKRAGIGHVRIVVGDTATDEAVRNFNTDASVHVFLLQAGPAAAGLTLTVSSYIILMEPFATIGEEAQALNRCHRIGQKKHVHAETFYVPDSIEERMLALRPLVAARGGTRRHAPRHRASAAAAGDSGDDDDYDGMELIEGEDDDGVIDLVSDSEGGDDLAMLSNQAAGSLSPTKGASKSGGSAATMSLQKVRYLLGLPNTLEEAAADAVKKAAELAAEQLALERAQAESAARAAAEHEAACARQDQRRASSSSSGVKRKHSSSSSASAKRPNSYQRPGSAASRRREAAGFGSAAAAVLAASAPRRHVVAFGAGRLGLTLTKHHTHGCSRVGVISIDVVTPSTRQVRKGDCLIKVNATDCSKMTIHNVVAAIVAAQRPVKLTFLRW